MSTQPNYKTEFDAAVIPAFLDSTSGPISGRPPRRRTISKNGCVNFPIRKESAASRP
jgi:hypothetical protein